MLKNKFVFQFEVSAISRHQSGGAVRGQENHLIQEKTLEVSRNVSDLLHVHKKHSFSSKRTVFKLIIKQIFFGYYGLHRSEKKKFKTNAKGHNNSLSSFVDVVFFSI